MGKAALTLHGVTITAEGAVMRDTDAPLTLSQAIDLYIAAQRRVVSPSTVRVYGNMRLHMLKHFGDDTLLTDLDYAQMMAWRDSLFEAAPYEDHPNRPTRLNKRLSTASINRLIGTASSMFNWFVEARLLTANPLRGVRRPKAGDLAPKALSDVDYERMLSAARIYRGIDYQMADAYTSRATAVLWFLNDTGCRAGGLVSASLDTLVVFDDGAAVDVVEKYRGGGKQRTCYLSEVGAIALLEWLDNRPPCKHRRIFCALGAGATGRPMTPYTVNRLVDRIAKRANVTGYSNPHAFRHRAARRWIMNGASLTEVAQMLGHSDVGVTHKHYARFTHDELRKKHREVN